MSSPMLRIINRTMKPGHGLLACRIARQADALWVFTTRRNMLLWKIVVRVVSRRASMCAVVEVHIADGYSREGSFWGI